MKRFILLLFLPCFLYGQDPFIFAPDDQASIDAYNYIFSFDTELHPYLEIAILEFNLSEYVLKDTLASLGGFGASWSASKDEGHFIRAGTYKWRVISMDNSYVKQDSTSDRTFTQSVSYFPGNGMIVPIADGTGKRHAGGLIYD